MSLRSATDRARGWAPGVILIALFLLGSARFDHFASASNIANIAGDYAYVVVAALGATLVITSGGIDLSVGSVVAFTSVLGARLIAAGVHPLWACALCVACSLVFGALQGLLIHSLKLPAFMVTLAGMFAIRAVGFLLLDHTLGVSHPFLRAFSAPVSPGVAGFSFEWRGIILILSLAAAWTLARRTRFGRNLHAIGGSERGARAMGVSIVRTGVAAYALAGLFSGLAGSVFLLGKRAGDPASGAGLELVVIAGVVIGGTRLSGGVSTTIGTLVGVLILGIIRTLIDFEGNLDAAWTSIAAGGLLLLFVTTHRFLAGGEADGATP